MAVRIFYLFHISFQANNCYNYFFLFSLSIERKRRNFESVRSKFKLLKHENQLYAWEKAVKESKLQRFKEINDYVLERFRGGLEKGAIVHDRDLRRWAICKSNQNTITRSKFSASRHWLWKFKTRNIIVSRKITKFVRRNYSSEFGNIEKNASSFVAKSLKITQLYAKKHFQY